MQTKQIYFSDFDGLAGPGLAWLGLSWAWAGLAGPGLGWLDLDWAGVTVLGWASWGLAGPGPAGWAGLSGKLSNANQK